MKYFSTLSVVLVSLSARSVSAACPASGVAVSFNGSCTVSNIKKQLTCDLLTLPNITEAKVKAACDAVSYPFGAVTDKYYQHDKSYMDGGSSFNDDTTVKVAVDAGRVIRFRNTIANTSRVLWPEYDALKAYVPSSQRPYMSNFNLTSSCKLRAAMCCFTSTRGSALVDNTDVCYHDYAASRRSNHVYNGFGTYNSSSPAHCIAFAWATDDSSVSSQYKGNTLAEVAYGTFLDKGYVKNVPGAPLCGCVDQMPTVTNAGCRTITVTNEKYTLKITNNVVNITRVAGAKVKVTDCGNFSTHYASISSVAEQSKMKEKITGGVCNKTAFLNERFYVPGTAIQFQTPNLTKWEHVAGMGQGFKATKTFDIVERNKLFMTAFNKSPNKIVMRQCHTCRASHQFIYYRRLTPVPTSMNLFNLLLDNWVETNNVMGTDFKLFSTYQDALSLKGNWTYCNFDVQGVGFPGYCGPKEQMYCQFNSLTGNGCYWDDDYNAVSFGFYTEKP